MILVKHSYNNTEEQALIESQSHAGNIYFPTDSTNIINRGVKYGSLAEDMRLLPKQTARFSYRQTGEGFDRSAGIGCIESIKGNSIAWNQLYGNTMPTAVTGHKYFLSELNSGTRTKSVTTSISYTTGSTERVCIDLTRANYPNIASATPTAAEVEAWIFANISKEGCFALNTGEVLSVRMAGIETVGFNQFDVVTGKAKLLGGEEYEVLGTYTALTINGKTVTLDDCKFTPAEDCELVVTGGDSTTCVHLTGNGRRNGDYETYWREVKSIDVTKIKGKKVGTSSVVTVFPSGMNGTDDAQDEVVGNKCYKRFVILDLGTLSWSNPTSSNVLYTDDIPDLKASSMSVCSVYPTSTGSATVAAQGPDKMLYVSGKKLRIKDTSYATGTALQSGLKGAKLIYELDTPEEYDLVGFELPKYYRVDDLGTENILPDNGALVDGIGNGSTLTGKLDGEGDSVQIFPEGVKTLTTTGAGDKAGYTWATKTVQKISLDDVEFTLGEKYEVEIEGDTNDFYSVIVTIPSNLKAKTNTPAQGMSSSYPARSYIEGNVQGVSFANDGLSFELMDVDYSIMGSTDPTQEEIDEFLANFASGVAGSSIYYELDTPKQYLIDNVQATSMPALTLQYLSKFGGLNTMVLDVDKNNTSIKADSDNMKALIPEQASTSNQLSDKAYVDTAVSTASATFRGTYNLVTDLQLTPSATKTQITTALITAVTTKANNDYVFVQVPSSGELPADIVHTDKYKYNGTTFAFEYSLDGSGYTKNEIDIMLSDTPRAIVETESSEALLDVYQQILADLYQALTDAQLAIANAKPDYVGEDNYVYHWNSSQGQYTKTTIYVKGAEGAPGTTDYNELINKPTIPNCDTVIVEPGGEWPF